MGVIFRDFSDLVRSNLHSLLQNAKDPIKVLDLRLAELKEAKTTREHEIGQAIEPLEFLKAQLAKAQGAVGTWEARARDYKAKADSAADPGAKNRYMDNAKTAAVERQKAMNQITHLQAEVEQDSAEVENAKTELKAFEARINEAEAVRADLEVRLQSANLKEAIHGSLSKHALPSVDDVIRDATASVEHAEARGRAASQVAEMRNTDTPAKALEHSELHDAADEWLASLGAKK